MSKYGSEDVERLAAAFAALSNPQRLRMFVKLASTCCAGTEDEGRPGGKRSFCCATEVGDGLELAASTVSHHLKELRQAGLMQVERQGRRIECRASSEMLERIAAFFAEWSPAGPARRTGACARGSARGGMK